MDHFVYGPNWLKYRPCYFTRVHLLTMSRCSLQPLSRLKATRALRVRFSGRFVLLPTPRVSRSSIRATTTPPGLTKPLLCRHLSRQQAPQAFLTGKSGTKLPLLAPLHKDAYSELLLSKKKRVQARPPGASGHCLDPASVSPRAP